MAEETKRLCDAEDILCQTAAHAHLRGLVDALGGERFAEEFPELQGLDEKLIAREAKLKEDLARCGPSAPAEAAIQETATAERTVNLNTVREEE